MNKYWFDHEPLSKHLLNITYILEIFLEFKHIEVSQTEKLCLPLVWETNIKQIHIKYIIS